MRDESRPAAAYKLGASLTGPLFFGYVHKLMGQAVADGVTCLYFLARDGQILLEIAKIIKSHWVLIWSCATCMFREMRRALLRSYDWATVISNGYSRIWIST